MNHDHFASVSFKWNHTMPVLRKIIIRSLRRSLDISSSADKSLQLASRTTATVTPDVVSTGLFRFRRISHPAGHGRSKSVGLATPTTHKLTMCAHQHAAGYLSKVTHLATASDQIFRETLR